jgi:hypothetical protein
MDLYRAKTTSQVIPLPNYTLDVNGITAMMSSMTVMYDINPTDYIIKLGEVDNKTQVLLAFPSKNTIWHDAPGTIITTHNLELEKVGVLPFQGVLHKLKRALGVCKHDINDTNKAIIRDFTQKAIFMLQTQIALEASKS